MSDLASVLLQGELDKLRADLQRHITSNDQRWSDADKSWDLLNDSFDAHRLDVVTNESRIWDAILKLRRNLDVIEQMLRKDTTT